MVKATLGTWLSYGTTIVFQVLFALRFGTGHAASAYVLVFALIAGLSGVLISTAQTVVASRLLAEDGSLRAGPLKLMGGVVVAAAIASLLMVASSSPIGLVVSHFSGFPPESSSRLVELGSVALLLQVLGGAVGSISLVRGWRLVPAVAPAFPTLISVAGLALLPAIDVREVLILFVVGSFMQFLIVLGAAAYRVRLKAGSVPHLAPTALVVLVSFFLLSLLFPFERAMSGLRAASEVADYDYAMRSLRAVQQLVLGGAALASLGDWSAMGSGRQRGELARSLLSALAVVTIILVLATSIGLVSANGVVAIVYQHGRFVRADTDAVSRILLVGLPGFCAEGISLVLTAALSGARQNVPLAAVGLFNVASRVVLTIALAPQYGAEGVAAGYSITQLVLLGPIVFLVSRRLLVSTSQLRELWPTIFVVGGTLGSAVLLALFASGLPGLASGAIIVVICGLLWMRVQPLKGLRAIPQ